MRPVSFSASNHITLLHSGAAFFPALIAAIDAARFEIYLETYIFAADETAAQVQLALERAAQRGVKVRVITDWLGTGRQRSLTLSQEFQAAAVMHRAFNPWFRRGVARMHRKMCVVDRQTGFVGGLNIIDDMVSDDDRRLPLPAPRWDFAISIGGPLVTVIHVELEAQWLRIGEMKLLERFQQFKRSRISTAGATQGAALAGLVLRDNLRNRRTIQRAYLQALGRARQSALLTSPYFAPGRKLRRALEMAAKRGVEVTLLLGVGHYRLQDAVSHSYYPKLLKAGVRIVEYRKTALHAKVAVVDDNWATVGSSNFDGLSLLVNQEANVVINDAEFSRTLRRQIEEGIADGVEVEAKAFANLSWFSRARYGTAFFLYRMLMRIIAIDYRE
ncbi:phospholipase D family protein [Collimonas arenae]|uniref:Cardiolipin synthase B n=1 Tax=Collimonas arenae TaxID=279058 RepID=A0A127QEF7_9BURK|nr:phospholipase D-like domain-containing protein [Collimonas arenae]AMO98560.1 phospholipase D family protein [Collimonas arenae]AMP08447.1 phospholipase D family protein [Collimonas arenae]